ncbi:MAG: NAD-dependent epimerase/dehydratase family protein/3-beta hydroxysteroid dehydrogenase/isomerase family protein [uncultured bacterium]|nr:MAG: NAD-dependent epimerase/dehydratase family protein/3-beta hydroxysteroid dehydrogenase/isomerase family protein [uncultured bacterium]
MNIFITGSTGFIGQHLCRSLTEQNHHVFALVRNPIKIAKLPKNNITVVEGSLESFADPKFALPECDVVIHLAGTITANRSVAYHKENFEATRNLFECLLKQSFKPKRLIYASSQAAAGPSRDDRPLTENDLPRPVDDYGIAKLKAEQYLLNQCVIPVTIMRPPTVIGPLDTNVLNLFKIVKKGVGFVAGRKKQPMSFVGLADLISAIHCFVGDSSRDNKIFFVANDSPTATHELWQEVATALGKKIKIISVPKPLLYAIMQVMTGAARVFKTKNVFDRKYYTQICESSWLCSSEKLKKEFPWRAKQSLAQAIAETAKSYQNAGWI